MYSHYLAHYVSNLPTSHNVPMEGESERETDREDLIKIDKNTMKERDDGEH